MAVKVRDIDPRDGEIERSVMFDIECPWCAGPATVEVAERDEFECAGCAIRVEVVAAPVSDPLARAA
ncbi:MAG TPA: hypothetical protein VMT36_06975 [Candidatus Saccharimonadia bacterium]|nr:hypothetical protein [Candidatus Saccharimonadia bacterium]